MPFYPLSGRVYLGDCLSVREKEHQQQSPWDKISTGMFALLISYPYSLSISLTCMMWSNQHTPKKLYAKEISGFDIPASSKVPLFYQFSQKPTFYMLAAFFVAYDAFFPKMCVSKNVSYLIMYSTICSYNWDVIPISSHIFLIALPSRLGRALGSGFITILPLQLCKAQVPREWRSRWIYGDSYGGFHSHGGTPKWMVWKGKNPTNIWLIDDWFVQGEYWQMIIYIYIHMYGKWRKFPCSKPQSTSGNGSATIITYNYYGNKNAGTHEWD